MKKFTLICFLLIIYSLNYKETIAQVLSLGDGLYQWDTIPNNALSKHNAMAIDASNNKWLAMVKSGLYKYNSTTGVFTNYNTANSLLPNDSVNNVYTVGNTIYACTNKGLAILDAGNWTIYNTQNSGLSNEKVLSVFKKGNNLWVGTTNGLFLYDGINWIQYLESNTINCILQTSNNTLWVGTNLGLKKYSNNIWTVYNTSNTCISSNKVKSFVEDINGNLWISTEPYTIEYRGKESVFKLDVANNLLHKFSEVFPETEFFPSSVYYIMNDVENKIYFLFSLGRLNQLMFIIDSNENYKTFEFPSYIGGKNSLAIDAQKMVWITFPPNNRKLYSFNQLEGKQYIKHHKYIDINNIRARINCDPSFFWDFQSNNQYEYPKNSGKHTIFESDLWIGGMDNVKKIYAAAAYYHERGADHRIGPILDSLHEYNYNLTGNNWLGLWKLNASEILNHIQNWHQNGYVPIDDILNWPAHGDTTLGEPFYMAPFCDYNHDGKYNPLQGDYPIIKGDQAIYYVINTNAVHTETGGKSMKLEEQIMVYAYHSNRDALNNTIFVDYKIINKDAFTYDSLYLGLFTDLDIGYCADDYIGCDVSRSTYFGYNGDNDDGAGNPLYYGENPPAQAVTFLSHFMDGFKYFNHSTGALGDPDNDAEYYNLLLGRWKGGQPMYYGGDGYSTGVLPQKILAKYMFPGLTDTLNLGTNGIVPPLKNWREETANNGLPNNPNDRRGLGIVGPLTFNPHDTIMFTVAYITGRDTAGPWSSVENTLLLVDTIINLYNNNALPNTINALIDKPKTETNQFSINIYPNPSGSIFNIKTEKLPENSKIEILNLFGDVLMENVLIQKSQINLGAQPAGIYVVRISTPKEVYYKKIIKL